MVRRICLYSTLLLWPVGSASSAAVSCAAVAEGLPTRTITTGPVRLYVKLEGAYLYDEVRRMANRAGSDCRHTKPDARTELLVCSNGLRAEGVDRYRPCTARDRYSGESHTRALCAYTGSLFYRTDWEITDRTGQVFTDYGGSWTSSRSYQCALSSSGKYESRGYRVLKLTAGDYKLHFVREELDIYEPKRQPSF